MTARENTEHDCGNTCECYCAGLRGGYRKGVEDALTTLAVLDSSRAVGSGATLADGIRAIRALLSKGEG